MVQAVVTHLALEIDAVNDALQALQTIRDHIIHRHGDAFRAYDRKLEAWVEAGRLRLFTFPLPDEPFRMVATCPELDAMVAEGAALGLLVKP